MIKVEVIEDFKYAKFDEIKDTITRYNPNKKEEGKLYFKDTFECDEETCEYLTGKNPIGKVVIKIIEVEPKKEKLQEDILEDSKIEYIEKPTEFKATFKNNKKKKKK